METVLPGKDSAVVVVLVCGGGRRLDDEGRVSFAEVGRVPVLLLGSSILVVLLVLPPPRGW